MDAPQFNGSDSRNELTLRCDDCGEPASVWHGDVYCCLECFERRDNAEGPEPTDLEMFAAGYMGYRMPVKETR